MCDTYHKYPNDSTSSIYQHYYNKNTRQTLSLVHDKLLRYDEGFLNGHKTMLMSDALLS
jgi:hypothetical protein